MQTDYYYQYTECDSTGSRWRVAIPLNPGSCLDLPPPTRGTDCCRYHLHVCGCALPHHVTALLFSRSFLLSGWDVLRDEQSALHAMRGRVLLLGQQPSFRPMGRHPCRFHQSGQLPGPRTKWGGCSGLQQVTSTRTVNLRIKETGKRLCLRCPLFVLQLLMDASGCVSGV